MIALLIGAGVMAASGYPPDGSTLYQSQLSNPAGTAVIVQSGPKGVKPTVRKSVRPGLSILQQDSGGNAATIIQQQSNE